MTIVSIETVHKVVQETVTQVTNSKAPTKYSDSYRSQRTNSVDRGAMRRKFGKFGESISCGKNVYKTIDVDLLSTFTNKYSSEHKPRDLINGAGAKREQSGEMLKSKRDSVRFSGFSLTVTLVTEVSKEKMASDDELKQLVAEVKVKTTTQIELVKAQMELKMLKLESQAVDDKKTILLMKAKREEEPVIEEADVLWAVIQEKIALVRQLTDREQDLAQQLQEIHIKVLACQADLDELRGQRPEIAEATERFDCKTGEERLKVTFGEHLNPKALKSFIAQYNLVRKVKIIEFESLKQEASQTLSKYLTQVQEFVQVAYPSEPQETTRRIVVWTFLNGLHKLGIQASIIKEGWVINDEQTKDPEDILKITESARQGTEAAKATEKGNTGAVGRVKDDKGAVAQYQKPQKRLLKCWYCQSEHEGNWFTCEKRGKEAPDWTPSSRRKEERDASNSGRKSFH